MITKYHRSLLLVSTALSLGVVAPATAQTSSTAQADNAQQIEEVIVTATRREERLQDVPISITVFNQQQLANHNVVNAQDIAAYTPSMSVNTDFGSQNTSFSIRGFSQDIGTQPTVGVFFDDVVAPRGPSQGTAAGDGAGPGDFFDLQNVQVLKGPQGTLFGRNTTGGDVLLVPQKPTDEFGGYVEGSFGNYSMKGAQGVINIPINDSIRVRFGIDHMTRDGFLKNTSGIGPTDFNDVDYTSLRASVDIDVTSNLENYTVASYTTSSTNGDVQKMAACDPTGSAPSGGGLLFVFAGGACNQLTPGSKNYQGSNFYDVSQSDPNPFDKYQQWRVINTTTWRVSDNLTVKNIASYAEMKQSLSNPLFGTNLSTAFSPISFLANITPPIAFDFAEETLLPGIPNTDESTYTEEFQLQGNAWDNRLIWQAGLYMEGSDPIGIVGYQSPVTIFCTNPQKLQCVDGLGSLEGISIGSVNFTLGTTSYKDYAAYAQTTYKLTDEISLTGGIRFTEDREENTSSQITYTFPAPTFSTPSPSCTFPGAVGASCTRVFHEQSQAPTWLLDIDYKPDDNTLAYIKYSRGYRSGLIVQNIAEPFNYVAPERVDAYETGLKTSFDAPVKGTLDVAAFYNDFTNQQLLIGFDPYNNAPVSPTAAPVNAGTSHIFGGELEATIIPYDGVTLDLAYTYLYAELVRVRNLPQFAGPYVLAGAPTPGDPLEISPRNKLSFTPSYQLPVDESLGKITLSATFTHTSRQLTNYEDSSYPAAVAPYALGMPINTMSYVPATNLLDLNLNWEQIAGKPVDLSVFATNVTGLKYYNWFPGLGTDTSFETAEVGPPCFYGVRVKIHFGED